MPLRFVRWCFVIEFGFSSWEPLPVFVVGFIGVAAAANANMTAIPDRFLCCYASGKTRARCAHLRIGGRLAVVGFQACGTPTS